MSCLPDSPRLVKGGLVLVDADTCAVQRVIALQYSPDTDTLSRTLQVKGVGAEDGARSEALRVKGPPVEIVVDAESDATEQFELADNHATHIGLHRQLAALDPVVYQVTAQLNSLGLKPRTLGARQKRRP